MPSVRRCGVERTEALLAVREERHEARALDGEAEHLLVLEAEAAVVTGADVAEVIDERLHRRVVFVIDVRNFLRAELALL